MSSIEHARRLARQRLESLQRAGLQDLVQAPGRHAFQLPQLLEDSEQDDPALPPNQSGDKPVGPDKPIATATTTATSSSMFEGDSGSWETDPLELAERERRLVELATTVAACTRCSELARCRNRTVFGVGPATQQLCLLGEGPGADEDRQGEPFVGAAGQLLNRIIEACGMAREEVYILNTVKCRPPRNRNPNEQELENCWPYAIEQLELLQPEFICCLGSVAARTLLGTKQSIGRLRGQLFRFRGSKVSVTYHPAYLLRNPSAKRQVWDDMKMLMAAMGRPV